MSALRDAVRAVLPRRVHRALATAEAARLRRLRERKLAGATARFDEAYAAYWQSGVVPDDAEELLFLAAWASGGTHPQQAMAERAPSFDASRFASFPDQLLSGLDVTAAVDALRDTGCYIAPFQLDDEVIAEIAAHLEGGPATPRGDALRVRAAGRPSPQAPTWWMQPADILRSPGARQLLHERKAAEVAGRYLGVDPLVMSVALWKSYASESPDKSSAQFFHYDNDRAMFVKLFVYLTDVELDNGPTTYVPGSHGAKPTGLLHGERLADDDVAAVYPRESWLPVTGPRGTVFLADTRGFHKGGHVAAGHRSMFQITLASDRFGALEPPVGPPADAPVDLGPAVQSTPRWFAQLFPPTTPLP